MTRQPPRSTLSSSSAASDVYKRQAHTLILQHAATAVPELTSAVAEPELCSPDQPFCVVKLALCHLCCVSGTGTVREALTSLIQAAQSNSSLEWLTSLTVQALWRMLLPSNHTRKDTPVLSQLPPLLRRAGVCSAQQDLTAAFTEAQERAYEILRGTGQGMALFQACLGPEDEPASTDEAWIAPGLLLAPEPANELMLTEPEKEVAAAAVRNMELLNKRALTQEEIESMSAADYEELGVEPADAALLCKAGKGSTLAAESVATNLCWRAAFAALMWHVKPMELLQPPELVKTQLADVCWSKKLCTIARYDVSKWLKEHKSPLDDGSSGLQRSPSARDLHSVTNSVAQALERAQLLLELYSGTYLEFADPAAFDGLPQHPGMFAETVHLQRTVSCPSGRVIRSSVSEMERTAHIRQFLSSVSVGSADETEGQVDEQKAVLAVLLPLGADEPVDTLQVRDSLLSQQQLSKQLVAAYQELVRCLKDSTPESKVLLAEAVLAVLGAEGWQHPVDTCEGCGLVQESRLCQAYHELCAVLVGVLPQSVARIGTLWKPMDIEFVARMELPSRLIQVAMEGGEAAPRAWKLTKSLVMLATLSESNASTKKVHSSVVESVVSHLQQSGEDQQAELSKWGIAPLCLLALCLPAETSPTPGYVAPALNAPWIQPVLSTLLQLCFRLPNWKLSQGAFALALRVLRHLKQLSVADAVAVEVGAQSPVQPDLPQGSVMIGLLVELAHTDADVTPGSGAPSSCAREVFCEMATAAIMSLRQLAIWQPAIEHFLTTSLELTDDKPLCIPDAAVAADLGSEYGKRLHHTNLSLAVMGGHPDVIHSGVQALGPGGLVLVTHYEIGDKNTNVLSLPRLNAFDVVEITELEPSTQFTVREGDIVPVVPVVRQYLQDMVADVSATADDTWPPQWCRWQQCALAIKATAAHMEQQPEDTAQVLAEEGLAWDLVRAAQDAVLVDQCNIDDSIQVLELLAHQVLLPIATGHDRRNQLPVEVLENLNEISFTFGCPLSTVTEIFMESGGLETCDYTQTKIAVASRADFTRKVMVEPQDLLAEVIPEGMPSTATGDDPESLPEPNTVPVRQESPEDLGMQSVPTGVGKLELAKKHALIQDLLRNEEIWRTNAALFLARAYQRLSKLHALRAASRLLQHWPASIPVEVESVSQLLMLIYRCVACGMEKEQLMGCVSSIVGREDCSETTAHLIQAACKILRVFVVDHIAGKAPRDAALEVGLAIISAATRQTAPCVQQVLLTGSTLRHLVAVSHLSVGPQRRTVLRLLSQVVAEMPNVLAGAGSMEQWNELWLGLQEAFWGVFQQTVGSKDGGIFGSLSLQRYTELFVSVRKAINKAAVLEQAPPAARTISTAQAEISGSSDAEKALARFMAVADGAVALFEGGALPAALLLGPGEDAASIQHWMSLVELMHADNINVEYQFGDDTSLELHQNQTQWSYPQYQQLASCLDSHGVSIEELPDWASDKIDLVPYSALQGESPGVLQHRTLLLLRFSALMMSVLPLLDLFSKEEGSGEMIAIRKMRGLILGRHKSEVISKVLVMCRAVSSQPRGSRGSWCNIEINRLDSRPGNSIFRQIFNQLRSNEMLTHNDLYRGATGQMWYIDFTGEQSMDWGGAFRESFVNLGHDICSDNNELMLRVPNHSNNDGFHQDTWVPNPECQAMEQYEFMGRLMAAAILSDESLPLRLPPIIWKQLAGMKTAQQDLREIDIVWCRNMDQVRSCEYTSPETNQMIPIVEEDFQATFPLTWSVLLSSGKELELVPSGLELDVTYSERQEYVNKAFEVRLLESTKQIEAIQRGLTAVIPIQVLKLWTFKEFDEAVCGLPDIPLEALQDNVVWDIDRNAPEIKHLWAAVERFNDEERSLLLRFSTGRSRLPCKLKISSMGGGPNALPTSHTCFFQLCIPPYRDSEVAYEKIRYAIHNCMEIDGD
eukprot:TRINITY_DN12284_c0_g1_i1.p1 TRINITY_DN12284_c0_g1~~TRINITY_DN12284_c0_g1_i1.p1  ORF type:complete len:1939 (+),score=482.72 TRINITY_DN12284_c0_g1_i1:116-5932(+)